MTNTNLPDNNKGKTAFTRLCDARKQTVQCHRYFYPQCIKRHAPPDFPKYSCLLLPATVHPKEKH